MSTVAAVAYVTVRCYGCGRPRELTARQARRAGKCAMCLRLSRMPDPEPEHFQFWLEMFTDWEIVVLISKVAPASQITADAVAAVRERMARPARVLSSVSERAGAQTA